MRPSVRRGREASDACDGVVRLVGRSGCREASAGEATAGRVSVVTRNAKRVATRDTRARARARQPWRPTADGIGHTKLRREHNEDEPTDLLRHADGALDVLRLARLRDRQHAAAVLGQVGEANLADARRVGQRVAMENDSGTEENEAPRQQGEARRRHEGRGLTMTRHERRGLRRSAARRVGTSAESIVCTVSKASRSRMIFRRGGRATTPGREAPRRSSGRRGRERGGERSAAFEGDRAKEGSRHSTIHTQPLHLSLASLSSLSRDTSSLLTPLVIRRAS